MRKLGRIATVGLATLDLYNAIYWAADRDIRAILFVAFAILMAGAITMDESR